MKTESKITEIPIKWTDEGLVRQLEDLLGEAKKGELTGLVYVSIWQGNSVSNGWAGLPRGHARATIGELNILSHELSQMALDSC